MNHLQDLSMYYIFFRYFSKIKSDDEIVKDEINMNKPFSILTWIFSRFLLRVFALLVSVQNRLLCAAFAKIKGNQSLSCRALFQTLVELGP